jgi:signal transduction histidine kinase
LRGGTSVAIVQDQAGKIEGRQAMSSVVNLNRFRKAKKRAENERRATENRAAAGRTKIERQKAESERQRLARELDSKRIE